MVGTFSVYHFSPINKTEKTSSEINELFIQSLDDKGLIMKQSDINAIYSAKYNLFNEIESRSDALINTYSSIYKRALVSLDSILSKLALKTLNFNENDTAYFLGSDATFYSKNIAAHSKRIEKYIKIKSYDRVINTDNYTALSEANFNIKANEFSKTIISKLQSNLKVLMENSYPYVESTYLNAICLRHDPHSSYFTEEKNREFSKQLSSSVESFGFYIDENENGVCFVSYIEPGGAAWQSNEVNEEDVVLSIKLGADLLTNEDKTAEDFQYKLDNTNEKKITITLKKQNGLIKKVTLVKQKTTSVDNSVKGYLLSNDVQKIGYISLPSFYTDMDNNVLPGCANDVAKELLKMENDSIKGLILDLRNNGGGSMMEAMNLAGIFINEGPLFIYKEKNKKPFLYKDINRGSIFKKPIIVLINELSASASELFSNIVKDYNLGLIVGQTSYGKGTAQFVIPLDTTLLKNNSSKNKAKDFIKITNGKFYRLNCSTHQGVGVIPDIQLPNSPGLSSYKESKEKFYLPADSVVKKIIYSPNTKINIDLIRSHSISRVAKSPLFKRYINISDSINFLLNKTQKVILKHKDYLAYKQNSDKSYLSIENLLMTNQKTYSCLNNTFDAKLTEVNEQTIEFNSKIKKDIENDIFINEAYNIMNDMLNTKN
ncbi:MAG: carboxy terminal-processing peptidase [Bacteroidota bacterium]|nr:carboxy terminal-processing peptidase [Bacteroidota bacterium]